MKTTAKEPKLLHPQEILKAHVLPAIRPHLKTMRELCAEDLRLTREVDESWPGRAGEEALQLWERAVNGDKEAETTLQKWGGREGYEEMCRRRHELRQHAHRNAANGAREAVMQLAESLKPAITKAREAVQKQFSEVLGWLDERDARTAWDGQFGQMLEALEKAEWRPRMGWGAHAMADSFGVADIIMEDAR